MMRLRLTFAKTGWMRYTGHLDLQQVWERTARRAGLPLAYTRGYHPGPKIQIAAALPLGFSGRAEMVDLWLEMEAGDAIEPMAERLQSAAPPGLTILGAEQVEEHGPALQAQVTAAGYRVTLLETGSRSELEHQVAQVLGAVSLPRERRGKAYDLRPLILSLQAGDGCLDMTLSIRAGATGRPEEVLAVMGIPPERVRIERTRLMFGNESKTDCPGS